jgi:hypothetical protein
MPGAYQPRAHHHSRALDKGLMGTLLRYPQEVRDPKPNEATGDPWDMFNDEPMMNTSFMTYLVWASSVLQKRD